jgi:HD-like signal output (HDOD) protein
MATPQKPGAASAALLDSIRRHPQLPGLGTAISRIVAMVDADVESIQELRNFVLADVHLTQRVLGLANSVTYRRSYYEVTTTVTRAIVVIGFEQVKLLALAMVFVEQVAEANRATLMKAELMQALQSSLLARALSRQLSAEANERAAIAALLGNVARLLLVLIDFERYQALVERVRAGSSEAAAAQEVLGMPLRSLTQEVLSLWGIPDAIAQLSLGGGRPPVTGPSGRLERIVSLATTTAQHLRHPAGPEREAKLAEVRKQCVTAGGITAEAFDRWVAAAEEQMAPLQAGLEEPVAGPDASPGEQPEGILLGDVTPPVGALNAIGKPANSQELVLARLQDLTQLIAERRGLSAILLTALECLHAGFGYSRSHLLLRDAGTAKMRARVWCGAVTAAEAKHLEIDLDARSDFFAAAIRRGSDLQIQDTRAPQIAARLPGYFLKACGPMSSFILLPIVSENVAIACILVGRDVAEPAPISAEDVRLLRTVRGQIVLAMKTVK